MLPKYSQEVQQQTESAKLAIFVLFLEYVRNVMHYFLKSSQKQKKTPQKTPKLVITKVIEQPNENTTVTF